MENKISKFIVKKEMLLSLVIFIRETQIYLLGLISCMGVISFVLTVLFLTLEVNKEVEKVKI